MVTGERPRRLECSGENFTREYVELKTELRDLSGMIRAEMAKLVVKMESLESLVRDMQRDSVRLENQVNANRESIGALRGAASLLGGIAGMVVSYLMRLVGGLSGS